MIIKLFTTSLKTFQIPPNSDDSPDQTVDRIKIKYRLHSVSTDTIHHTHTYFQGLGLIDRVDRRKKNEMFWGLVDGTLNRGPDEVMQVKHSDDGESGTHKSTHTPLPDTVGHWKEDLHTQSTCQDKGGSDKNVDPDCNVFV